MRFDWQRFCIAHNVPFVTSGPNTARGHISIKCPYCGESDHSQHMGLSLDRNDAAWGCFRNSKHRGRNPRRLIQRLLNVSFEEAVQIAKEQATTSDEGELDRAMDRLRADPRREAAPAFKEALFPRDFKPLIPGRGYTAKFLSYLEDPHPKGRGFGEHSGPVCERYGVHYALSGDMAWRLIFPIHDSDGRLLGWTGRDIRPNAWLRYKTTEALPNRVLYNAHLAARSEGDTLVIVEGPVDAVKVDYFGAALGCTAVATLGTALPRERKAALASAARRFDRVALLFDEGTLSEVLSLAPELSEASGREVELWRPGHKDPGAMSQAQIVEFLHNHLNKTGAVA